MKRSREAVEGEEESNRVLKRVSCGLRPLQEEGETAPRPRQVQEKKRSRPRSKSVQAKRGSGPRTKTKRKAVDKKARTKTGAKKGRGGVKVNLVTTEEATEVEVEVATD